MYNVDSYKYRQQEILNHKQMTIQSMRQFFTALANYRI